MIYPSIGELTNNNKINRYTLVIATAKAARIITDEYVKQREYAEKQALKDADKKGNIASLIRKEYMDDKAVKTAISGLYSGEFEVIEPDGKVEFIGNGNADTTEAESDDENEIDVSAESDK